MTFPVLKGRNPYAEQVQGKSLQSSTVTILLERAQELGASPALEFSIAEVIKRLGKNAPRVAIIMGSADHTAHVSDYETSLIISAEVWRQGGVPFIFGIPTLCDGTAQSTIGMSYSLLSRNLTSLNVITQMEAHSYHAAVVIQGCDKTPFAILDGLLMLDNIRQKRGDLPLNVLFAPIHVLRGGSLKAHTRNKLISIGEKAARKGHPQIQEELLDTLSSVLLCTTNQSFKGILDRAVNAGLATLEERFLLENEIAAASENKLGGICSFNGTGNSSRFLMAALGLVHPSVELLCQPVSAGQVTEMLSPFFQLIGNPKFSVNQLVFENLENTIKVHSCLGGSTNLVLHVISAMNYSGFEFSVEDFFKIKNKQSLPDIFSYSLKKQKDIFLFAKEKEEEKHHGMESVFKVLHDLGVSMNLDAVTNTGRTWRERMDGLLPLQSAMLSDSPIRNRSGVDNFTGNFFSSTVVKISGMSEDQINMFDNKVYVVCYFENEEDANQALLNEKVIFDSIFNTLSLEEIQQIAKINKNSSLVNSKPDWNLKKELYQHMLNDKCLRIAFVISGQGPVAFGIPEMFTPMENINSNSFLRDTTILFTDGRFSGVTQGPAFGHVTPEAYEKGGILFLKTGDLLLLDFNKLQINLIDSEAFTHGEIQVRDLKDHFWFENRVDLGQKRIERIEQRREFLPPVARMDQVTSAEYGIVPESVKKLATRTYDHEKTNETSSK